MIKRLKRIAKKRIKPIKPLWKACCFLYEIKDLLKNPYSKIIFHKFLKTSSFKCNPKSNTEIHSLVCHKHLFMYLLAIKSFLRFYNNIAVVVHDDGSLKNKDIKLLEKHVKHIRIIETDFADKCVNKILKNFPNAKKYRDLFCNAKQLFDFDILSNSSKIMHLDSDILFFEKPERVIDWILSDNSNVFLYEKHPRKEKFALSMGYKRWLDLCIGFMCLHKGEINLEFIEKVLSKTGKYDWWTGQNIFAILLKKFSKHKISYFNPKEYQSKNAFYNNGKIVLRHYWSNAGMNWAYLNDANMVINHLDKWNFLDNIFKKCEKNVKKIFFIQIGSNDGKTCDPLNKYILKYGWDGILVEPVKYIFKRLANNYKNNQKLVLENVALSDKEGYRPMYRLKKDDCLPCWHDQISSFFLQKVLKHKYCIPNIEKCIIKEKVKCVPFTKLIEKHNVKKIDLLHIDAEGYDFEVIKQALNQDIKPKMILFEHKHLNKKDRRRCIKLLSNYKIKFWKDDTFCISKGFLKKINNPP